MKPQTLKKNGQQKTNGEKSLEQNSQNKAGNHFNGIFEGQIRECFGRVVYSHKTHEKCTDILLARLSTIKLWQIILSAITTGGFIAAVFGAGNVGAIIGIIISTSLLVLNTYTKNYDLGEIAQKHKQAANDLWLIREKYLSLLTDIKIGTKAESDLITERDALAIELYNVYSGVPSTNVKAYKKAQVALQQNEDMTFNDEEIDTFLPRELKKNSMIKFNK